MYLSGNAMYGVVLNRRDVERLSKGTPRPFFAVFIHIRLIKVGKGVFYGSL